MLVVGLSGCGKINIVMYMLRWLLVCYDKVYVYIFNFYQDKICNLIDVMVEVLERVGYNVLEIK